MSQRYSHLGGALGSKRWSQAMQSHEKLNQETKKMLWRVYRHSQNHQVKMRAHCIILIDLGYSLEELIKIFGVSRKTIYNWYNNWSNQKLVGLYNRIGRGRKEIFNEDQKILIKNWALANPKNLNTRQRNHSKRMGNTRQ